MLGCHADSVWVPLCKLILNRYLFLFAKQQVAETQAVTHESNAALAIPAR